MDIVLNIGGITLESWGQITCFSIHRHSVAAKISVFVILTGDGYFYNCYACSTLSI